MKIKYNAFILLVLILTVLMVGCSEEPEETVEQRELPVRVEKVTIGSLSGSNILNGMIVAEDEVDVTPMAIGEINKIHVKKGDKVQKGDVIAELNNSDERNALEQQKAALRQAESALRSAQKGRDAARDNLKQAESSLSQAETALQETKKGQVDTINVENANIQDGQQHLPQGQGGLEGVQSLESTVEQAKAGVATAKASVNETDSAVEQAQAGVDQAKLGVEAAQARLNDKIIKSPISGEVVELGFKVGEMANQQVPLATIVSVDNVKVSFNVLPEMLSSFKVDDDINVKVGIDSDEYVGKVSYISSVSSGSGLFTVEAKLKSDKQKVKPGMIATVEIDEVLVDDSILVPTDAIIQQEGLDVVFVVEDDVAIRKEVEVIRFGTELTAVKGDLVKDDRVVTSGQNLLEDGETVKIMEEE